MDWTWAWAWAWAWFAALAAATGAVTGYAQGIYWVQPQDWGCRYRTWAAMVSYQSQYETVGPRSHRAYAAVHWLDRAGLLGLLLLGHWAGGVGAWTWLLAACAAWEARECGYAMARWGTPVADRENVMGEGWEDGSENPWWFRSGVEMHALRWAALAALSIVNWRLV